MTQISSFTLALRKLGKLPLLSCIVRSSELNNFLAVLDKRYTDKIKGEGVLMAKKLRQCGSSSTLLPPSGAPSWALNEARNGIIACLLIAHVTFLILFQITPSKNSLQCNVCQYNIHSSVVKSTLVMKWNLI